MLPRFMHGWCCYKYKVYARRKLHLPLENTAFGQGSYISYQLASITGMTSISMSSFLCSSLSS